MQCWTRFLLLLCPFRLAACLESAHLFKRTIDLILVFQFQLFDAKRDPSVSQGEGHD